MKTFRAKIWKTSKEKKNLESNKREKKIFPYGGKQLQRIYKKSLQNKIVKKKKKKKKKDSKVQKEYKEKIPKKKLTLDAIQITNTLKDIQYITCQRNANWNHNEVSERFYKND